MPVVVEAIAVERALRRGTEPQIVVDLREVLRVVRRFVRRRIRRSARTSRREPSGRRGTCRSRHATCNRDRGPCRPRRTRPTSDARRLPAVRVRIGSDSPAARCGCAFSRQRRSAAIRRRCASTASRRTRPCPPGTPRSSAACANGSAWPAIRRRWTCLRAACGSRHRWPASSALSTRGSPAWRRCGPHRRRIRPQFRHWGPSASLPHGCLPARRSPRPRPGLSRSGLPDHESPRRRPARPCSSGNVVDSCVSCRVPHPEAVILA